ncbi:MAG: glycosyltransferase family 4 protein [Rhodocyclaceae bacterium]|nr:glycosyltransferase family 4 protein [Rhodocyclaceae bacterium]MDZ4213976.1 glycosyltransferase family 4 protein [Rhodocyclaceae bacterium]
MLRIMFVTGSLTHGGAERHSITLMNQLARRGHECHAVYLKQDDSQRDRVELLDKGSLYGLAANGYLDRRALTDFAAHLTRVSPDVIVAANAHALLVASLARIRSGLHIPLLVTYHSTRLLGMKEQLKMLVERFFFMAADCLVFVCENQRRHWRKRLVFARRTEVIHNGVDPCRITSADFSGAEWVIRRQWQIAPTDYVIGMIAVLRPEKNHLQLLDAIVALRQQGIPARALLVGDGPMRTAIEQRAEQLGITHLVSITGLQEDVRPYITACHVITLCSITETFSLAAIEAMAMRRPVVHSEVGGAAEMIVPDHNGLLFPVGDTAALVKALATLANPAEAKRMGDNARAMVEQHFTEEIMINRYEETLHSLVRGASHKKTVTRQAAGLASIKINHPSRSESHESL